MKSNATIIYSLCLIVGDFLALVAAFLGGYLIRGRYGSLPVAHPIQVETFVTIFASLMVFWILVFALLGLYNASIYERRFPEIGRIIIGAFIGLMFVTFWAFILNHPIFPSKLVPIYGFLIGLALVIIFRNILRLARTLLFRYQIGLTKVLIVGKHSVMREIARSLADSRQSGYQVIGVVGAKTAVKGLDIPTFQTFKEFLGSGSEKPHGIIQAELYAYESKNREILNYAQENHVSYRFVPGNSELFVGNLDVELFRNSVPVIAIHRTPLFGWGRVVKRSFDLIVGGILMLIALFPMLLIVLALKITEPRGKIFYRPKRYGRFNEVINLYKFRSMYQKYCMTPEEGFARMGRPDLLKKYRANGDYLSNDPRITPIGRFLRKTSLDELPQLINVLKGDLSLVGPRPLDTIELSEYSQKSLILAVKTGMTGLAVVSGRRDIPFEERRQLDLYYVQNWSFWLDVMILFKTVRAVLKQSDNL